jgi:hypothetical protein
MPRTVPTRAAPPRDWFDDFWEKNKLDIPIFLRSDSFKEIARGFLRAAIEGMGQQATTPEGIRQIIAFARIAAILKGTQGVIDSPNPSPEQVAEAVERLVKRVKP